jgi:hypothetical protein
MVVYSKFQLASNSSIWGGGGRGCREAPSRFSNRNKAPINLRKRTSLLIVAILGRDQWRKLLINRQQTIAGQNLDPKYKSVIIMENQGTMWECAQE